MRLSLPLPVRVPLPLPLLIRASAPCHLPSFAPWARARLPRLPRRPPLAQARPGPRGKGGERKQEVGTKLYQFIYHLYYVAIRQGPPILPQVESLCCEYTILLLFGSTTFIMDELSG